MKPIWLSICSCVNPFMLLLNTMRPMTSRQKRYLPSLDVARLDRCQKVEFAVHFPLPTHKYHISNHDNFSIVHSDLRPQSFPQATGVVLCLTLTRYTALAINVYYCCSWVYFQFNVTDAKRCLVFGYVRCTGVL